MSLDTLTLPLPAFPPRSITSVQLGHLTALLIPEATMTADEELGPSEVAKEFNVSPATVRRWEKAGILTPTRRLPGSRYRRYSRAAVDALHRRLEGPADPEPTSSTGADSVTD